MLSTKLNYHEHWKKIVEDIEDEYRMLSLDYMRRTFHGFTPDTKGETQELIWWSVFAGEQQKFIKACRNIIERPRHRLRGYEVYLRAAKREATLDSLAFTLNHIWLQDHIKPHPLTPSPKDEGEAYGGRSKKYPQLEEDNGLLMAAEAVESYNKK